MSCQVKSLYHSLRIHSCVSLRIAGFELDRFLKEMNRVPVCLLIACVVISRRPGVILCVEQSVVQLQSHVEAECNTDNTESSLFPTQAHKQAYSLPRPVRLDPLGPETTANSLCSLSGQYALPLPHLAPPVCPVVVGLPLNTSMFVFVWFWDLWLCYFVLIARREVLWFSKLFLSLVTQSLVILWTPGTLPELGNLSFVFIGFKVNN